MPTRLFSKTLLWVTALFVFTSCNDKAASSTDAETKTSTTFDLAAAKKTVEDGNTALMDFVKKGDSTGFAGMYTADAKVMPAGMPPITGREGIAGLIGGLIRMGMVMNLSTVDVWGSEALVAEEGTYSFKDKAGKELDNGKYIVLWKMEDGKWKLFRDCWNSNMSAPH